MSQQTLKPEAADDPWQSLDRWRWTLHYHRPEQLARRAWYRFRDAVVSPRLPGKVSAGWTLRPGTQQVLPLGEHAFAEVDGDQMRAGELRLLNQPWMVGWPIDWRRRERASLPPLVEFHLQYHGFLLPWATSQPERVSPVVSSWLEEFGGTFDREAWHPYCISRRLPVWLALVAHRVVDAELAGLMLSSIVRQVRLLARRLERDIGGNHLWENAHALVLAGATLIGPDADRWWRRGRRLLDACLDEQLHSWGEHFERSPAYQLELVEGLGRSARAARLIEPATAIRWEDAARTMAGMVDAIRHPDGTIPLFGDSTLDAPNACAQCSNDDRSGWIGEYYVHQNAGHQLTFDAGDMGPEELPAHAHADLLGFELSLYGQRAIVDRGTYAYTGDERDAFRRSSSHNVLLVDGAELADTWSSFRMGRRGRVRRRDARRIGGATWIMAEHDAFQDDGIASLTRHWLVIDDGPWFLVDVVVPADDRVHEFVSHIHWAPGLDLIEQPGRWSVSGLPGPVDWQPLGASVDVQTGPSRVSERFYLATPSMMTRLSMRQAGVTVLGWGIWPGHELDAVRASSHGADLEVVWTTAGQTDRFRSRDGLPWCGNH